MIDVANIHAQFDDLLRLPFVRGGRVADGVIDCLGIVLEMARRRGRPAPDPWERLRELHAAGQPIDHLFPPGYMRVEGPPQDDDVAVLASCRELGVGYVLGGLLYSANADSGPCRVPVARARVQQLWRWSP